MVFVGGGLKPPPVRDFGGGGGSGLSPINFDSTADDGNSLAASLWHKGGFKTRPYKLRDRDVLPVRGSLLAHGAGDENLGRAFRAGWRAALEQEARRGALLLALSIEALAGLETLAAAERHSSGQTVRRAVRGFHAPLPGIYDPGIGQANDRPRCLLRGFPRLAAQLIELLLRALHLRFEFYRAFLKPASHRIHKARLLIAARCLRAWCGIR